MDSKRALLSKRGGERGRDPSFLTGKQTIDSGKGKGAKEKWKKNKKTKQCQYSSVGKMKTTTDLLLLLPITLGSLEVEDHLHCLFADSFALPPQGTSWFALSLQTPAPPHLLPSIQPKTLQKLRRAIDELCHPPGLLAKEGAPKVRRTRSL
jgi:hypothetical protein